MALHLEDIAVRNAPARQLATPRLLQGGKYYLNQAVHITGTRALFWGYEPGLARHLLIERVAGLSAAQTQRAMAGSEMLPALEFPHLARCTDLFVEHDALYLPLVVGAGTPLTELSDANLRVVDVIAYGIQLCNVLNYARHASLPDVAIDPSLAFVTTGGRVKFTGMASLLGIATSRYHSRFLPTIGDGASRAVFGVGATLHFLLTGWNGTYAASAPALATLRPDLAPPLCHVITRALQRDPAERWSDSAALRHALLPFAS